MTKAALEPLTAKAWYSNVLSDIKKKKMFCMSRRGKTTHYRQGMKT